MARYPIFLIPVLLWCGLAAAADLSAQDLLPRPQEFALTEGAFSFAPGPLHVTLTAPEGESLTRLAALLNESLARLDLDVAPETAAGEAYRLTVSLDKPPETTTPLTLPDKAQAEGYELVVTPLGVELRAATAPGLFYGLMTFEQLTAAARTRGARTIPGLRIVDWPALTMRGYHEDYGRDQLPTIEDHKRSIRTVAQYKMNTYLWFIEPDHFVYAFDPDLGKEYDRFRFDEIRELVAYAKEHFVEVIPVVELLGHMEMTLRLDRYRALAEMPEGGGDLCATSDASFDLVKDMVNEIAPAFGARYFHCGLDESYAVGKGRSAPAVKAKGIEQVFADYYTRMDNLVKSNGQIMMMYADIVLNHPSILDLLPKDINMMFWDYAPRAHYDGLDTLKASGYPVTALSGLWDWNNLYPNYAPAFQNMATLAAQAASVGALGHFVSSWGDGYRGAAGVNLSELNTFGFIYCGAVSWNPAPLAMEDYAKAFALDYFGLDDPAFAAALTRLGRCQDGHNQEARRLFHDDAVQTALAMAGANETALAFWRQLKQDAESVHAAFSQALPARNVDYLLSFDLAAKMLGCAADMALACHAAGQGIVDASPDAAEIIASCKRVLATHQALWGEYQGVWSATNRPLNLERIGQSWNAASASLARLIADLASGAFPPIAEKALRTAFTFDGDGAAAWQDACGTGMTLAPVEGVPPAELIEGGPSGAGRCIHLNHGARVETLDANRVLDFKYTPFLVEAWVRHHGQREQQYGASIFSYGLGGGFRLGLNDKGEVLFTLYGIGEQAGTHSIVPPDEQWHHVAVNFHHCRQVDYYVDGRLTDQLELKAYPQSPSTPLIRVGNEIGLVTPLEGDIDRIRVSSGIFGPEELDAKP